MEQLMHVFELLACSHVRHADFACSHATHLAIAGTCVLSGLAAGVSLQKELLFP